ncbi:class I SAM-dependent methyltransferase [Aeoliella sp.]|uniref:class I SAM-dependent methyltransferase n=1 Tax=Aeoliella sp. TaxID=2795800 RepID=UPI003CCBBF22
MPDDHSPLDIFEGWSLYDCVVNNNYMLHEELIEAVAPHAARYGEPLRVLDLGCGDGYMAAGVLKGANVESYRGVDLSESGLKRAAERLAPIAARVEVHEGSIRAAVRESIEPPPNFLLASFSLHHYRVTELGPLIADCQRLIAAGGLFVWIDARRGHGESREEYLRRFHEVLLPTWSELSEDQMQEVRQHMNDEDFPASDDEKLALAKSAGFDEPDVLYADDYFSAHLFRKTGTNSLPTA